MIRVLDRYVYREALPAVLLSVMVFTALHLLDRIQDFTNLLASGAPVPLVLSLWAILVLSFLTHTIPMGVLVGVVIAAARLASDLEVVAFGASGVSPFRLFRPFLVVAAGAALVIANLTWWINPWGYATFARLAAEVPAHVAAPMIQERVFTRIGDLVVYADEALAAGRFRGLVVADEHDRQWLRIITAAAGHLVTGPDRQRIVLRLSDGAIHESNPTLPGWYRVTRFTTYDTPMGARPQVRMSRNRPRPERDMTAWELISNTRALEWTRNFEKAEMFITASIDLGGGATGVTVPAKALFTEGDRSFLFVSAGERRFERRNVVATPDGSGRLRVTSGLRSGERVVTDGALLLNYRMKK